MWISWFFAWFNVNRLFFCSSASFFYRNFLCHSLLWKLRNHGSGNGGSAIQNIVFTESCEVLRRFLFNPEKASTGTPSRQSWPANKNIARRRGSVYFIYSKSVGCWKFALNSSRARKMNDPHFSLSNLFTLLCGVKQGIVRGTDVKSFVTAGLPVQHLIPSDPHLV